MTQKIKVLQSRVKCLKAQNDVLRAALKAERAFWNHFLFCPECQMQRLNTVLCPESLDLKRAYSKLTSAALKKTKL